MIVVFWPIINESPILSSGYIIGWSNENGYYCVAGLISELEFSMELFQSKSEFSAFEETKLLGYCSDKSSPTISEPLKGGYTKDFSLNIQIDSKSGSAVFPFLSNAGIQWIFYELPNPVNKHFYFISESSLIACEEPEAPCQEIEPKVNMHLVYPQSRFNLQKLMNQMNHADQLASLFKMRHGPASAGRRHCEPPWIRFFWQLILAPIVWLVAMLSSSFAALARYTEGLWVCRSSFFLKQLQLKIEEWRSWQSLYQKLCRSEVRNTALMRKFYIRFHNGLWLSANDFYVGVFLGLFVIENHAVLGAMFNSLIQRYTLDNTRALIVWLMGYPAGLKLNHQLNSFLGELFLWLVGAWERLVHLWFPLTSHLFLYIGAAGLLGSSLVLGLAMDVVALATFHLFVFYATAAKLYAFQLSALFSLSRLFRGKRKNRLRSRIDSCHYDLDQLLLGTILLSLLLFTFPTNGAYYLLFLTSRAVMLALYAGVEAALVCLNEFPLFQLILRAKDAKRIAGKLSGTEH